MKSSKLQAHSDIGHMVLGSLKKIKDLREFMKIGASGKDWA